MAGCKGVFFAFPEPGANVAGFPGADCMPNGGMLLHLLFFKTGGFHEKASCGFDGGFQCMGGGGTQNAVAPAGDQGWSHVGQIVAANGAPSRILLVEKEPPNSCVAGLGEILP
jgi:hypothetical protein